MTTTTAETTLLAALDRTYRGRPAKPSIYRRLHEMLDSEETVHCVADGYRDYTSEHLLLLTDCRVLLVKAPIPGRWKAMRDVPATAVLGGRQVTGTLTAASVEIGVQGQKPVTMKIGSHEAAAELLRTLEALRAGGVPGRSAERDAVAVNGAPPETDGGPTAASVPSEAQGLLARGERVHSVFEGWSTWSSEHQLLLLTDHRVLLAGEQTPGSWSTQREAAAPSVTGVRSAGGTVLKAASVTVEVRDQKPISLGKGAAEPAQAFVQTLEGLLRQGRGPAPS
ncbi:hypothetical protein I8D64_15790 [Brachybacterium sp. MASK1Z-5]|uniref:YokE-like PH domain-containing protein n=1 Tax=Brachybacterium halotolerans TaxID=2795215 RepID=A0ABS1BE01_9MICO|nr:hypothetical protein [Brachybacterium halotolerans]MBK0332865.1 hypothetical protein [Brachybacterium halotolerans]